MSLVATIGNAMSLAFGLVLAAAAAGAGDEAGAISARRFAPLPEPLAVRVEVRDDSSESVAVRDAVVRALARKGILVTSGPDATVSLWLDGEVRRNAPSPAGRPDFSREASPGAAREDPTSRFADEDRADRVTNLLSNSRDAVVTGRRTGGSAGYDRALRYVVNAAANDTATGRRVWQGHVRWDGTGNDTAAILANLAPRLVPHLGSSLAETAFDLD